MTGINHWWTYQGDAIGNVNRYMVNVANGNLIVQGDDLVAANKGIALAFRRTYNSFSQHDYANTDGSVPSNYGNGWTNTFDAHLGSNSAGGISVFDIDGARYDYSPGSTCLVPPAGQYATLCSDGANGYFWTKKSGTVYYFYSPAQAPANAALAGRLMKIWGRNHNTFLAFSYYFDGGDASSSAKLNKIVVTTEDGRSATLQFANFGSFRLLSTLTWPDGTLVTYNYDASANLTEVDEPGYTAGTTIPHQYSWWPSHLLQSVSTPLWVTTKNSTTPSGSYVSFAYLSGAQINRIQYNGYVNPTIPDGYSTGPLQGGSSAWMTYKTISLAFSTSSTAVTDTDGHSMTLTWDGLGRVTQTQVSTGSSTLTTSATWDSASHVIALRDTRGFETDFAYDANGNAIGVGEPSVSATYNGASITLRPTRLYSYDANNNLVAYCDPIWAHAHGADWNPAATPAPTSTPCPSQAGTTRYSYTSSSVEPFGELTQATANGGYSTTFAYDPTAQGGADFGLPTAATGASFTQANGTVITPKLTMSYDAQGDVRAYSNGVGTATAQYDLLGRLTWFADADNGSQIPTGGNGGFISETTTSYRFYYANGALQRTETPVQHLNGTGVAFAYDVDGDLTSETRHFGGVAATTTKFYDGADRLVEVVLPRDARVLADGNAFEYYSHPWMTRYFYDLTQNGAVSYNGVAYRAHGNLFKAQKYVPGGWADQSFSAFDAADRVVAGYKPGFLAASTTTYDSVSGLVTSVTNEVGDVTTFTYDSLGRRTREAATGPDASLTPALTYAFDADGRIASVTSSSVGTQSYIFDADGRLISTTEPAGGTPLPLTGMTNPSMSAKLTYSYYPNGWKSALNAQNAVTQVALFSFSYSYAADGRLVQQKLNYGTSGYTFGASYSNAGRLLTSTDPFGSTSNGFDQLGRMTTRTLGSAYPGFQYNIGYDDEGDVTGWTTPNNSMLQFAPNSRGEIVQRTFNTGLTQGGQDFSSAYGFMYPQVNPLSPPGFGESYTYSFDAINGAQLGGTHSYPDPNGFGTITDSYAANYDASGRFLYTSTTSALDGSPSGMEVDNNAHTYDSLNRVVQSTTRPSSKVSATVHSYAWGPNGHPIVISMPSPIPNSTAPPTYTTETLHWDGDRLLFTTNGAGQVDDVKISAIADYQPLGAGAGLTVIDRDYRGSVASSRNQNSSTGWTYADPSGNFGVTLNGGSGVPPSPPPITQPLVEGIYDGLERIYGVRNQDTGTGIWTAPDAYAGVVGDPASQMPYVFNRNNAVSYADPSGFAPIEALNYVGSIESLVSSTAATNGATIDNRTRDLKEQAYFIALALAEDDVQKAGGGGLHGSNPDDKERFYPEFAKAFNADLERHAASLGNRFLLDYKVVYDQSRQTVHSAGSSADWAIQVWIDSGSRRSGNYWFDLRPNSVWISLRLLERRDAAPFTVIMQWGDGHGWLIGPPGGPFTPFHGGGTSVWGD